MWSLQTAAWDRAQHRLVLEVTSGQLCPPGRVGRDGDTLGSGLAKGIFTMCLFGVEHHGVPFIGGSEAERMG